MPSFCSGGAGLGLASDWTVACGGSAPFGVGAVSSLRSAGGVGLAAGAACFAGAAAAPSPSAAILATTVLTCTVVPSETLISCSTPEVGEGISASTLSVEISKSGSSRCTFSPGFFSHLVMVPSTIDSPIWGMITSVGIGVLPLCSEFHRNLILYIICTFDWVERQ